MEALVTKRREELQDGRAATLGGEDLAFRQVIKAVLQRKVSNEENKKEISQLAQMYTGGRSVAARRHGLIPDCPLFSFGSFCPGRVRQGDSKNHSACSGRSKCFMG